MSRTFNDILKNPLLLIMTAGHRELLNWMNDETYLKLIFRASMRKKLDLNDPQTYSEKLQWLKLYDRKPLYTQWVDKYQAKTLAQNIIGSEFIIPTIGLWDHFDDIDFNQLPDQFVLKCTHDSGGLVICKDKSKLDKTAAKQKIEKCLKHSFYWGLREWPYKDVVPRIIAEPYLEDNTTKELRDYKFFCFDGEVKALFVATERGSAEETKFDFFDSDYKHLPFINGHPNASEIPQKPTHFEEMKALAAKLSQGIPQVRADLYECNGKVYFGEMTFFHWSGLMPYQPEEWDYTFGSWIKLPR